MVFVVLHTETFKLPYCFKAAILSVARYVHRFRSTIKAFTKPTTYCPVFCVIQPPNIASIDSILYQLLHQLHGLHFYTMVQVVQGCSRFRGLYSILKLNIHSSFIHRDFYTGRLIIHDANIQTTMHYIQNICCENTT